MSSYTDQTLVLEAGNNPEILQTKIRQIPTGAMNPIVAFLPGQKTKSFETILAGRKLKEVEIHSLKDLLPFLKTPLFSYLPAQTPFFLPPQEALTEGLSLRPWIPPVVLLPTDAARLVFKGFGWVAKPALLETPLGEEKTLGLLEIERLCQTQSIPLDYLSSPTGLLPLDGAIPPPGGPLNRNSKILALVPHFNCQDWLEQALRSLVHQTHPLDGIVVMDDHSSQAPLSIVQKFKEVTLLRSPENVGPYRLVQSVIHQTRYGGYLFQDSDDWSSLDRLELLLQEGERTGAELIGTQELMYFGDNVNAFCYPLDINAAFKLRNHYQFCYPSSLVSRDLILRLGGNASGLRFSGDFEFLSRALFAAKIVNLNRYGYFRRVRKNSLITSETTGLASPARKEIDDEIRLRLRENKELLEKGFAPRLAPLRTAEPLPLEHLCGPPLLS